MATNTTNTFTNHTGNGTEVNFSISFSYILTSDIDVTVAGDLKTLGTHYTISGSTVTFTSGNVPTNGAVIKIARDTSISTKAVDFQDGSVLTEQDLDNNTNQILFAQQEFTTDFVKRDGTQTVTGDLIFEGSADDANETTLAITNPTADRTITVPDITGTLVTTGDTGTVSNQMIANDAVTGTKIADDQINSEHYIDGSIDNQHIANSTITSAKIVDATLDTATLADNAVTEPKIIDDAVTTAKIASNAVTNVEIASGTILTGNIANGNITTDKIADSNVTTAKLANLNVTTEKLASNAVTNSKIADNSIDSEHYVDGSIDTVHIGNSQITTDKIAGSAITSPKIADLSIGAGKLGANSVTNVKIATDAVTTAKIADGAITNPKLADDAVTSAKIADTSVANNHLQPQCVTNDKIATATILSGNIATGNILESKLADNAVTTAKIANDAVNSNKIADNSVNFEHIVADAVRTAEIQDNAVTIDKIADAAIVTNSEQASHSVNDTTFFTTSASDARYFNVSTGDTIKDGDTFPDNDTTIATTAAINDRIIDLVDDVGGFVPIANETSFPTSNPDVNDGNGTIVSVKAASTNLTPSGTTVTIANGRGSGLAVIITGVTATIPSGFGFLVETTSTDHTYAFHRLVPKATEVTTVAGKAVEIGRLGTADAVADMALLGTTDVVADMNLLATSDVVADMALLATTDVIADMALLAVADVISDMNDLATSGNITAMSTCSTNIASINNASANIASANNFGDQYQVAANNPSTDGGGNALAAGDLYFNTSANELKVYNGSSWQGGVTATGTFAATTGNTFTGDNRYNDGVKALFGTGSDLEIFHDGNVSRIADEGTGNLLLQTNGAGIELNKGTSENMLKALTDGAVELYYDNSKKLNTTSGGIYVTGNIELPDDGELKLGNSADLAIYHNDSLGSSWIYNSTGALQIRSDNIFLRSQSTAESYINCTDNGAVDLYFDGTKMLSTESRGAILQKADACTFIVGSTNASSAQIFLDGDSNGDGNGGDYSGIRHTSSGHFEIFADSPATTAEIHFKTGNGSHRSTIDASGHFKPAADSTYDLGLTGTRWRNLYADTLYGDGSNLTGINTDLVADTSPQLGGDLDLNGNAIVLQDNEKIFIGTSNDGSLFNNGSFLFLKNHSGAVAIQGTNYVSLQKYDNSDIGVQYVVDAEVKLYYDNSIKFETTSYGASVTGTLLASGNIKTGTDTGSFYAGTGDDLRLFHNGQDSFIRNSTGVLKIQTGTENAITATINGAVELYYDNVKKFETTSGGVQVTGEISHLAGTYTNASGGSIKCQHDSGKITAGAGDDLQMYHDGSNSYVQGITGFTLLYGATGIALHANSSEYALHAASNGATKLYYDGSQKLATSSSGVSVTGSCTLSSHLVMGASDEIKMGGSSQMTIWHTGSDFNMYNNTGNIIIANAAGTGTGDGAIVFKTGNNNTRAYIGNDGHFYPASNNSFDLGTDSNRWRNVFTNDLNLSNEGGANDVDGTWGSYTIQEGAESLFLINKRNGKKYKFNLTEVS